MSVREGFSLVEVLVALFVVALVSATGTTVLALTLRSKERLEAVAAEVRALELARAFLKDDLAAAIPRPVRSAEGMTETYVFEGGEGRGPDVPLLAFTRGGWTNPQDYAPRGTVIRVEYALEDRALVRNVRLRPDAAPDTPVERRVLMEDVTDVEVRFALPNASWVDVWEARGDGDRPATLPAAVEITLHTEGFGPVRQIALLQGAG